MLTKNEQGNWVAYEGQWYNINEPSQDMKDTSVESANVYQHRIHTVVELMYHWVSAYT